MGHSWIIKQRIGQALLTGKIVDIIRAAAFTFTATRFLGFNESVRGSAEVSHHRATKIPEKSPNNL